jgi:hypothetical protein
MADPQQDNPGGDAADVIEEHRTFGEAQAADVPQNVKDYMTSGPTWGEDETRGPPPSERFGLRDESDSGAQEQGSPEGEYNFGWSPRPVQGVRYDATTAAARMEGYTWPEINDHVTAGLMTATEQGYTPREVDEFLGRGTPEDGAQRMEGEWQSRIAQDEDIATGLSSATTDPITPLEGPSAARVAQHAGQDAPDPVMPEPGDKTPPSGIETDDQGMRNAYRDALNAGQVRTPQDFAERYMGAAWKAADAAGIDPDPHALTRAAGEIAAGLPSNEELTDQAIRIARQTGSGDVQTIKSNIVDAWAKGTPVAQTATDAFNDPNYADQLTRDDTLPDVAKAIKDFVVGAVKGFAYPDEEFNAQFPAAELGAAVTAAISGVHSDQKMSEAQASDQLQRALRQGPPPAFMETLGALLTRHAVDDPLSYVTGLLGYGPAVTGKAIRGEHVTPEEAFGVAQIIAGFAGWRPSGGFPVPPEVLPPEPRIGITDRAPGGLPGGAGPIIEHEPYTGPTLKLPPPPDMPIIDFERPLGEPPRLVAPSEALRQTPTEITVAHADAQELSAMPAIERAEAVKPATYKFEQTDWVDDENPGRSKFIIHKNDEPIARATITKDGTNAYVDSISSDIEHGFIATGEKNTLGGRDIRNAARTYFETNPDIETIGGLRVTGARGGEGKVSQAGPTADMVLTRKMVMGKDATIPEPDPKVVTALAEGYDMAKGLAQHFYGLVGDTLKDTSGSLNLRWRTPEEKAFHDQFSADRDVMQRILIPSIQRGVKNDVLLGRMAADYFPVMAPHVNEFAAASRRGDGPGMVASEVGKFVDNYENGNWSSMGNSKLAPVGSFLSSIAAHGEARTRQAINDGLLDRQTIIDNWYKHLWKDPHGHNWDQNFGAGSGREGDTSAQTRRTIPKQIDGLRRGLSPKFDNPIEQALYGEHLREYYINALDAVKQAMGEGVAYWAKGPRDVGDITLDGIAARNKTSAKKNLPLGNTGPTNQERLYARPGFAHGYNNSLSTGMNAHPVSANLYNRMVWMGNATTALKLLWPGFHYQTLGGASWAHGLATLVQATGRGQFLTALGMTGRLAAPVISSALFTVAGAPTAVAIGSAMVASSAFDTWVGFKDVYKYTHGIADPIVDMASATGLRLTPRQDVYHAGATAFTRVAAKGGFDPLRGASLKHPLAGKWDVKGGIQEIVRELGRDLEAAMGDPRYEGPGQRIAKSLYRVPINLPLKEAGRAMQTVTSPFFDYIIPAQKMGAFHHRYKSYLDANPFASDQEKWFAGRQITRGIEHNFGELNQDTRFGPKMVKNIANSTMLSVGWKYGTEAGFLTALGVDPERGARMIGKWQGPKSVYLLPLIGLITGYMVNNTMRQIAYGQPPPWETGTMMHDLINGRTGGVDKYGDPQRIMIPNELKEAYDQAKIVLLSVYSPKDAPKAVGDYVFGAMNPIFQLMRNTFDTGVDAIGKSTMDRPGGYSKFVEATLGPIVWDAMHTVPHLGDRLDAFDKFMGTREAAGWNTDFDKFLQRLDSWHQRNMKAEQARDNKEKGIAPAPRGRPAGHGGNHSGAVGPNSPNWGR